MSKLTKTQALTQDSGNQEWYTQVAIVEAARRLMGGIDLDPASCEEANYRYLGCIEYYNHDRNGQPCWRLAETFYSKEQDGLHMPWFGRVWMNHPFSQENNKIWPYHLRRKYELGSVKQACAICFAATSEQWFRVYTGFPQFFFTGRKGYCDINGRKRDQALKGSVITYMYPLGTTYRDALDALKEAYQDFEGWAK